MKRKREGEKTAQGTNGTNGINGLPTTTASTSYQRRLERRQAEREKKMAEDKVSNMMEVNEERVEECEKLEVKKKKKSLTPYIAFIGQLSYKTTAASVEEYFRNGGVEGPITVRLLTRPNKQKGKSRRKDRDGGGGQVEESSQELSRGMAFLELSSARALHQCLALHHTRLDGRVINVEKSSGGGKARKKDEIKALRLKQVSTMSAMVERLLQKFQQRALLKPDELDVDALRVLNKFDGALVERALLEVHLTHKLAFNKGQEEEQQTGTTKKCSDEKQVKENSWMGLEIKREKLLGETTTKVKKTEFGKKRSKNGEKNNNRVRPLNSAAAEEKNGGGGSSSFTTTSDTNAIHGVVKLDGGSSQKLRRKQGDTATIDKNEEAEVIDGGGPSLFNVFPTLRKRGGSKSATRGTRGGG